MERGRPEGDQSAVEREVGLRAMALRRRREKEGGRFRFQKQRNREAKETCEGKACREGLVDLLITLGKHFSFTRIYQATTVSKSLFWNLNMKTNHGGKEESNAVVRRRAPPIEAIAPGRSVDAQGRRVQARHLRRAPPPPRLPQGPQTRGQRAAAGDQLRYGEREFSFQETPIIRFKTPSARFLRFPWIADPPAADDHVEDFFVAYDSEAEDFKY
ncbi:hypothetical protein ZIOFF_058151 [Zingiber officinale]|uniref:Uncharacterized protein n=1 Tax=Zingiber officinale TaxID=94328 RepID=A0A8J5KJ26_ZINOF|nr:hypothetical protein ZIOFF_058151 [Zingiber officinale]